MVTGGAPADVAATARMSHAIVHRGPDEHGVWTRSAPVRSATGGCASSISATAHQPARSEDGDRVVVFNGEIYNFASCGRARGARAPHPRHGDTALIPHLYEEYGTRLRRAARGDVRARALGRRRERLVLARDRLGKKPLLCTRLPDGTFAFASELKALLRCRRSPRASTCAALDAYLALQYVPGTATALRGVDEARPGTCSSLERGGEPCRALLGAGAARPEGMAAAQDWLDAVRDTVDGGGARRMVADVPIGALLSGGIDSSVVVALMAQLGREPVHTFSVGFAEARYDERLYARAVAERYGTVHEELVLEPDIAEVLPRLAWMLDEPLGDRPCCRRTSSRRWRAAR